MSQWSSRPRLALLIRVLIVVGPILITVVATSAISRALPPVAGNERFAWWALLFVGAIASLTLLDNLFRRLAPVSALLKISLVFPDEAPNRFSAALKAGSTRRVQRRLDEIKESGIALKPDESFAEQMLEMITLLGEHDRLTRGHCERVRAYTDMIIAELGLTAAEADRLRWAALLHDLGKLMVPAEILNSSERPTDEEWEILKTHPGEGARLAAPIAAWLGEWTRTIGEHHERWDGAGYPAGLAGKDIHLGARIVAVADTYDVITSARSYKSPISADKARAEIARCAGSQFDPKIVRAFLAVGIGRLKLVAGPLAWLSGLSGLSSVSVPATAGVVGTVATAVVSVGTAGLLVPPANDGPPEVAFAVDDTLPPVDGELAVTTTIDGVTTTFGLPPEDGPTTTPTVPGDVATTTTTTDPTTSTSTGGVTTTTSGSATTTTTSKPTTTTPTSGPTTTTTSTVPAGRIAPDSFTVAEGGLRIIDVLANDSGLTLQSVSGAAHASSVSIQSAKIRYQHDGTEPAPESFTYTAKDVHGTVFSSTVTGTITPVNDAPVVGTWSITVAPQPASEGSVQALTATDPDNASHTWSLVSTTNAAFSVVAANVELLDSDLLTPGESVTVVVKATDSAGASDTGTVTITVGSVETSGLVISEYAAAGVNSSGDFIELHNSSGEIRDLTGLTIEISSHSTTFSPFVIAAPGTMLDPGEFFLLAKSSTSLAGSADKVFTTALPISVGVELRASDGGFIDAVGTRASPELNSGAFASDSIFGEGTKLPAFDLDSSISQSFSRIRISGGRCRDTNNNSSNFIHNFAPGMVTPRNKASGSGSCSPSQPPLTNPGHLVISEFRTDGPGSGTNDFVNIYNASGLQVNLTGWKLEFASGGTHTIGNFTLDPGQTFLAAGPDWSGNFDERMLVSPKNTDELRLRDPDNGVVDEIHVGPNSDELPILSRRAVHSYSRRYGCTDTDNWLVDFEHLFVSTPRTRSMGPSGCS